MSNGDLLSHKPGVWPAVGRFQRAVLRTYSKVRRFLLSQFRRRYVKQSIAKRKGECTRCGECCKLVWKCPYLEVKSECRIYDKRFKPCRDFPFDYWDLRWSVVPCGFWFPRPPYRRLLGLFARYGKREVIIALIVCALGIFFSALWLLPLIPIFVVALAFVLYFFRDPERRAPEEAGLLLAPADGKIVEIFRTEEPDFLGAEALKIAIFMSPLNVHVNRFPCEGKVRFLRHRTGRFHNAANQTASSENERNDVGIESAEEGGLRLLVRQIAGVIARRIVCEPECGERLERGQRFGMIKFGSRMEIFIPADRPFQLMVEKGQKVRAGVTVLGKLL